MDASNKVAGALRRVHPDGLFAGWMEGRKAPFAYRLQVTDADGKRVVDDAYRFPALLKDADLARLGKPRQADGYRQLGAHPRTVDGVAGTLFAVWAPNASRVAVVGDFNGWDGRCHGMRLRHDSGVWEIFVPGVAAGTFYKFEVKSRFGELLPDKADPYAAQTELPPGTAAIVADPDAYHWGDLAWMSGWSRRIGPEAPIAIYEVHLSSWRRRPEENNRLLSYTELADELVSYVRWLGFTHVELMPINEFPMDDVWGYRPSGHYAPSARFGRPEEFQLFVDTCHQAGIGVIADWVPLHFYDHPHGLGWFDGAQTYGHPDSNMSRPDWNTVRFDLGRTEVANYVLGSAAHWLERYHLDGLRIDALPALLYRDFDRGPGEWTPNVHGGAEDLEAVDFLRTANDVIHDGWPGAMTFAEETSGWGMVSRPTHLGGLGFGFKWDVTWVYDTLRYLGRHPVHRKYYQDEITNFPLHAFQENHVLALSHHHVGYGQGSLYGRIRGDHWQRLATLRLYYAMMYTQPGKKLMFMGSEFAQSRPWDPANSLDWHEALDPLRRGVQELVRDLNALYRAETALHQLDAEPEGFSWIDCQDIDQSIISYLRYGRDKAGFFVVICNYTPVIRRNYRLGAPEPGFYAERLNTDAEKYGGGNVGNYGGVTAFEDSTHGRPYSLEVTVPPFAAVILQHLGDPPPVVEGTSADDASG